MAFEDLRGGTESRIKIRKLCDSSVLNVVNRRRPDGAGHIPDEGGASIRYLIPADRERRDVRRDQGVVREDEARIRRSGVPVPGL